VSKFCVYAGHNTNTSLGLCHYIGNSSVPYPSSQIMEALVVATRPRPRTCHKFYFLLLCIKLKDCVRVLCLRAQYGWDDTVAGAGSWLRSLVAGYKRTISG
jgi:hypothetical protein